MGDRIASYMTGVKTLAGLTRYFHDRGYTVILPDYTQEPGDDGMVEQIRDWDVRNGVDFLAYRENYVFLVDAKGRKRKGETGELRNSIEVSASSDMSRRQSDWESLPASLRTTILDLTQNPIAVRKLKIVIPTGKEYMEDLPNYETYARRGRQELRRFGRIADPLLRDELKTEIAKIELFDRMKVTDS